MDIQIYTATCKCWIRQKEHKHINKALQTCWYPNWAITSGGKNQTKLQKCFHIYMAGRFEKLRRNFSKHDIPAKLKPKPDRSKNTVCKHELWIIMWNDILFTSSSSSVEYRTEMKIVTYSPTASGPDRVLLTSQAWGTHASLVKQEKPTLNTGGRCFTQTTFTIKSWIQRWFHNYFHLESCD